MSTIRQQIRDQALLELNTDLPAGVPETTKRRYIPGTVPKEARMAAFFGEESAARVGGSSGALTKRPLILAIQSVIVCEDPAEADDLMEPILDHIIARLGSTNLNKLAHDIEEMDTVWAAATAGSTFILVSLVRWRINYQTRKDNLSLKQ